MARPERFELPTSWSVATHSFYRLRRYHKVIQQQLPQSFSNLDLFGPVKIVWTTLIGTNVFQIDYTLLGQESINKKTRKDLRRLTPMTSTDGRTHRTAFSIHFSVNSDGFGTFVFSGYPLFIVFIYSFEKFSPLHIQMPIVC